MTTGPLHGVRVVELASDGPGPFCAMLLSDMGADVLRIDRADRVGAHGPQPPLDSGIRRGRRSAAVDLKNEAGVELLLGLVEGADALIEGYRPGVVERLKVGPEDCLARNPRLVYGRMTGWGQDGPMAAEAGHDLNYVAQSGLLHAVGVAGGPPVTPLNLAGDFGGGGMLLAFGVVAALFEAGRSGNGQVVDASMLDGATMLGSMIYAMLQAGQWVDRRGSNLLDGGAPYYTTYRTNDGRWVAVGALEPQFYDNLVAALGLDPASLPDREDQERWPELRARFAEVFATRTRDEWIAAMADRDACFSPVLSMREALIDEHNRSHGLFVPAAEGEDGPLRPAPAPRFSATPARVAQPAAAAAGEHTLAALADWGVGDAELDSLARVGAIVQRP